MKQTITAVLSFFLQLRFCIFRKSVPVLKEKEKKFQQCSYAELRNL
jgi:hypothetical protein